MKSNFEERRQARLEAFQRLASSNEQLSVSSYNRAHSLGDMIPMGQPILVGHHSEKRHRNHIKKIDNAMRKSVEASNKAKYYEDRAESLLNGTAISSDDPSAIEKLKEKLQGLEKTQELYKQINKIIKNAKLDQPAKIRAMESIGLKPETAAKLLTPDFCGRIGVPGYKLTNNNGNMRRIRLRIQELEKVASIQYREQEINGVKLVASPEDNRVQLFFPGKPSEEIRKKLKSAGFHWAPSIGAWMKYLSDWAIRQAEEILNNL